MRFSTCDEHDTCFDERQSCSTYRSHNVALLRLPGKVLFYQAKMASILTDPGSPNSFIKSERRLERKSSTSLTLHCGTQTEQVSMPTRCLLSPYQAVVFGIPWASTKETLLPLYIGTRSLTPSLEMSDLPARLVRVLRDCMSNWDARLVWPRIAMASALNSSTTALKQAFFNSSFRVSTANHRRPGARQRESAA